MFLLFLAFFAFQMTLPCPAAETSPTILGQPYSQGRVQFIPNNADAWKIRYELLAKAEKSIVAQYFGIEKDIFGLSFLQLLRRKALQGLDVSLMVDAKGSSDHFWGLGSSRILKLLLRAGVKVRVFNPSLVRGGLTNPVPSNHDKILVVDHQFLLTGGRNISWLYFMGPHDVQSTFSDCDVLADSRIEALRMEQAFFDEYNEHAEELNFISFFPDKSQNTLLTLALDAMQDWMIDGSTDTPALRNFPKIPGIPSIQQAISLHRAEPPVFFPDPEMHPIRVLDSHSRLGSKNELRDGLEELFANATSEVIIHTPYVVLTQRMKKLIQEASQRGVKILLHTSSLSTTDFLISQKMFLAEWLELLAVAPTLELYLYRGSQRFHQKVFIFDAKTTLISSYNMDSLSEKINSEIGLVVASPSFGASIRQWSLDLMDRYSQKLDPTHPESSLPKGFMYFLYNIYRAFY